MKRDFHKPTLMSRRSVLRLIASCGAVPVLTLAGCSLPVSDSSDDSSTPAPSLTMAIDRPICLDPGAATDAASIQIVRQLFDPLCQVDWAQGEIIGAMASTFDISDDAQTFTFHLHDATFHSGEPVTASSFKRAWERLVNPMSALSGEYGQSSWAYLLSCVVGYDDLHSGAAQTLSGVTCPDDHTLVVNLTIPYADFPALTTLPALAPVPAQAEDEVRSYARNPQGNGPFVLSDAWNTDSPAVYCKAFTEYYRGAPELDNLVFMVQQDTDQGYSEFLSSKCDVCKCPVEALSEARSRYGVPNDNMTLGETGHLVLPLELSCSCLVCNTQTELLSSRDVRQALSYAIDREALSEDVYRGLASSATGLISPSVPGAPTSAWAACTHDVAEAEHLLDLYRSSKVPTTEEGSTEQALSSTAENDEITLSLMYYSDGGHKNAMEQLVDQFDAVGITLELDPVEYDEYAQRLADGDFELARMDAVTAAPSLDSLLYPLAQSSSVHNVSHWSSSQADELLATARTQTNATTRTDTYAQLDALLASDMPYIPLTWQACAWVGADDVENLLIDPMGFAHFDNVQVTES